MFHWEMPSTPLPRSYFHTERFRKVCADVRIIASVPPANTPHPRVINTENENGNSHSSGPRGVRQERAAELFLFPESLLFSVSFPFNNPAHWRNRGRTGNVCRFSPGKLSVYVNAGILPLFCSHPLLILITKFTCQVTHTSKIHG